MSTSLPPPFPTVRGLSSRTPEEKEAARKKDQASHNRLRALQKLPGNEVCADCTAKFPGWAALPHGVFICIDCAQLHRHLGRHISQVKAINTGTYLWYDDEIDAMEVMGNRKANSYFYGDSGIERADKSDSRTNKERHLRMKYETKKWLTTTPSTNTKTKTETSSPKKTLGRISPTQKQQPTTTSTTTKKNDGLIDTSWDSWGDWSAPTTTTTTTTTTTGNCPFGPSMAVPQQQQSFAQSQHQQQPIENDPMMMMMGDQAYDNRKRNIMNLF
eukprot:CAMPEP_0201507636 /NCGR_PEP_ID=MMETSP0161_2-20130828/1229_1 /ASSEMBLY_ACC=CAM_ASM_000251 /TAXON_ID=180227 /ORGANISM="Neoparamoeba aestuarina, Strain SoJaBio B1-5/56/2" /LENGTH=271 /DNA_ID=CAMNT_0047902065 /DNA_START=26 /DNA_END=841 /DNA_ORIENTATION=-